MAKTTTSKKTTSKGKAWKLGDKWSQAMKDKARLTRAQNKIGKESKGKFPIPRSKEEGGPIYPDDIEHFEIPSSALPTRPAPKSRGPYVKGDMAVKTRKLMHSASNQEKKLQVALDLIALIRTILS